MFFGKGFSGYHGSRISGLDILVLSIIKNKDGISGYEIIQKINKKFKDLWTASAGTIYPLLNRLSHKEYVKIEDLIENNRQKKIYRITETGKEALKRTLESNLEPSINTLGDYIKTVFKANFPNERAMEAMMGCFPFSEFSFCEDIAEQDEQDYSSDNIKRIEHIISYLKLGKERLQSKINGIDNKIQNYSKLLEKLKIERDKNTKIIKIVENDDEFDKF